MCLLCSGLGADHRASFAGGAVLTQLYFLPPKASEGWVSESVLLLWMGCPFLPLNGNVKVTRKSLGYFLRSARPVLRHTLGEHPGHLGWATGQALQMFLRAWPGWVS